MKYILFLLISLSIYAQDTIPASKSVIALDKMNVVYRGVPNPISIAVNNAKSYVIYGNGVLKKDDGKYVLRPGSGNETKVFVEIENFDGSKVIEEHVFRIKGLPAPIGTLNNEYSTKGTLIFTLEEIKESKIGIKYIDFLFDVKLEVTQFSIKISRFDTITIEGNIIPDEVVELLKKVKKDDYILIRDIKTNYMFGDGFHKSIRPIIFQIVK
ncbi:GldM family protein [Flavobacterium sp.]|uniref:GldM family protein n=2 Tax=Flavobacterium sp. TaxID=239 RepID=UPI0040474484